MGGQILGYNNDILRNANANQHFKTVSSISTDHNTQDHKHRVHRFNVTRMGSKVLPIRYWSKSYHMSNKVLELPYGLLLPSKINYSNEYYSVYPSSDNQVVVVQEQGYS